MNIIPKEERTFAFFGDARGGLARIAPLIRELMEVRGHPMVDLVETPKLVFHLVPETQPSSIRHLRRSTKNPTWTYSLATVVTLECPGNIEAALPFAYTIQIHSHAPDGAVLHFNSASELHHTTMELGHTVYRSGERQVDVLLWDFLGNFLPRAWAKMVISTEFRKELPQELWEGDRLTKEMAEAGRIMESWGLLPAPFPIEKYLPERELRYLKRMYGIGGLSYGNLSVRTDGNQFWMSGTGVDKSNLREVGRDFIWVKGYDAQENRRIVSIPPHQTGENYPSVDLIEHWFIYTENPRVGAIVHIHGWMEGVTATHIAYPCGTYELGRSVADLVKQQFAAGLAKTIAVVGLKNHGLTVAGPDLSSIFAYLSGKVETQVPMG